MIARLQFGPEGDAINRPRFTLTQEIGWHRAQIRRWEAETLHPAAADQIAHHSREIERLASIAGEVA